MPLLAEKAAVERLGYDYASAKATLKQLVALAPDSVWEWIDLGDICVTTGSLAEADAAFRGAMEAARRTGDERDLSVSYKQSWRRARGAGQSAEALKTFRDGLAIGRPAGESDPGNAEWQRDLSVSYDRVGDVQVAQGNLPEALTSYRDGLADQDRLAKSDPATPGGSAICRCRTTGSATCWWRRAICRRR